MANGRDEDKACLAGQQAARIEALFDDVAEIKRDVRHIKECHEKRIARLERWRSWLAGATAVIGAYLGIGHRG
jgi:hypothetical protein